jgi:hypothetical protein
MCRPVGFFNMFTAMLAFCTATFSHVSWQAKRWNNTMASETDAPVHAFASYNKALPRPVTLVGNWQEEQALKRTTGTSRYEVWGATGVGGGCVGTCSCQSVGKTLANLLSPFAAMGCTRRAHYHLCKPPGEEGL